MYEVLEAPEPKFLRSFFNNKNPTFVFLSYTYVVLDIVLKIVPTNCFDFSHRRHAPLVAVLDDSKDFYGACGAFFLQTAVLTWHTRGLVNGRSRERLFQLLAPKAEGNWKNYCEGRLYKRRLPFQFGQVYELGVKGLSSECLAPKGVGDLLTGCDVCSLDLRKVIFPFGSFYVKL